MDRKNINRGFKKLRVWQDAVSLYILAYKVFANFPFELKVENQLLKLIESLQKKQKDQVWEDNFQTKYKLGASPQLECWNDGIVE